VTPQTKTNKRSCLALPSGREIEVNVRHSQRARRILLQVVQASGTVELVLPRRVSVSEGMSFVHSKARWIQARLDQVPPPVPFIDGAALPLLGRNLRIRHYPLLTPGARREGREIVVGGRPEDVPRAVMQMLRAVALAEIGDRVEEMAERLGRSYRHVSVRDPVTRWGSCSAKGSLSFSWRLVLGPLHALDYVVAHEVAHLAEMNHGRRFWRLVDQLSDHADRGREWLRLHGASLHRYGRGHA
jgi:predicted metal-dependent hydrolase